MSRHQLCEGGTPIAFNKLAVYARAGVGTVYRHFASSDELLDEIIARRVDAVVAILEAAVAEQNRSRRFARRYWVCTANGPPQPRPSADGAAFRMRSAADSPAEEAHRRACSSELADASRVLRHGLRGAKLTVI